MPSSFSFDRLFSRSSKKRPGPLSIPRVVESSASQAPSRASTPSTSNDLSRSSTPITSVKAVVASGVDNATYAFAIMKDAGEMLEGIPYVKGIAGIATTIMKIRDEVKVVGQLTTELIDAVEKRTTSLLESLSKLPTEGLDQLRSSLEEYHGLLVKIEGSMQERKESWLRRVGMRAENRDQVERFMRELKEFDSRFAIAAMTRVEAQLGTVARQHIPRRQETLRQEQIFPDILPPRPTLFLGREKELEAASALLLNNQEPRMVILGPGGLGKTSLLSSLLHSNDIAEAFPNRFFVACDQVTTLIGLLNAIANVFRFSSDQRGPRIRENLLSHLQDLEGRALFCLDNFEDTWDPPESRGDIELFLAALKDISNLGVIITMRGDERPQSVRWTRPYLPPLQPLEDQPAQAMFEDLSGITDDGRVQEFLRDVSNVPLAIELLARLVDLDGLEEVSKRWKQAGLKVFDRGDESDTRKTSVIASIQLSLKSPRIANVPRILDVLRMLSVLIDGLAESMLDALQENLGPTLDLRGILALLKRISLCYQDIHGRYRLLAPIREYIILTVPLEKDIRKPLSQTFCNHVINTSSRLELYDAVVPELGNTRIFVTWADGLSGWDEIRLRACLDYLWWEGYTQGIRDIALAETALSHARTPTLEALCRLRLAKHLAVSGDFAQADMYLCPALLLETGDSQLNGRIQMEIGDLLKHQGNLEESEDFLRRAVKIFQEIDSRELEANCLMHLAHVLIQYGRPNDAQDTLQRSLQLAKQVGSVLAEGNALFTLGIVYESLEQTEKAIDTFRDALSCYQGIHHTLGKANALNALGNVLLAIGQPENAVGYYHQALDLYRKAGDLVWVEEVQRKLKYIQDRTSSADE